MNDNFYLLSAQVIPILYLAIVFQQRAISGTAPNVNEVFGVPVKTSVTPKWLRYTLGPLMVLIPLNFFVGEILALSDASGLHIGVAKYFVLGTLIMGGLILILPLAVKGVLYVLNIDEYNFGQTLGRILFAILGTVAIIYSLLGIWVVLCR